MGGDNSTPNIGFMKEYPLGVEFFESGFVFMGWGFWGSIYGSRIKSADDGLANFMIIILRHCGLDPQSTIQPVPE